MDYINRVFSRSILGSVIFGTTVGKWLEKTVLISVLLVTGNPMTPVLLLGWVTWGISSVLAFWLLVYWAYIESNTEAFIDYVKETTFNGHGNED